MKFVMPLIAVAALLSTSPAFARTELSKPNPFVGVLQFDESDGMSDFKIVSVKLMDVSTLEQTDIPDSCPGDQDYCSTSSSVQSEQAVAITVSYERPYASTDGDNSFSGPQIDRIYLKPSRIPAATLAALREGHMGAKQANQFFGLKISKNTFATSEIDNNRTQYCEAYQDGPLVICPGTEAVYHAGKHTNVSVSAFAR